jgi:hypothetical protein
MFLSLKRRVHPSNAECSERCGQFQPLSAYSCIGFCENSRLRDARKTSDGALHQIERGAACVPADFSSCSRQLALEQANPLRGVLRDR